MASGDDVAAGRFALRGARLRDPAFALAVVQALALAGGGLAFRFALAAVDARAFHGAVLGGERGGGGRAGGEQREGGHGGDRSEVPAIHVPISLGCGGAAMGPRGGREPYGAAG